MTQRRPAPTEILTNLVITLLAPMFLVASGGDMNAARVAAFATVREFRAETNADLILVAKIIAFGLAALSAISLAMTDGIGLPMLLRLNNCANACDRADNRNRRALAQSHRIAPPPEPELPEVNEADVIASAEQAAALARQARRPAPEPAPQAPAPQPAPAQAAAPQPAQPVQDISRATWATAFATVAQEYAAEMANLPPAERWAASMRSKALSGAATDLLNGMDIEPYRLGPSTA